MTSNLQACFDGILRTIWINSERKYNSAEIEFTSKTATDDAHPSFVLDYEDPRGYRTELNARDQYLGVQFRRVSVCPVAYAIRTAITPASTNHLRSWVFQAKNTNEGTWTTLDERMNEETLSRPGAFTIAFVEARRYFTEFRVLQTAPSHANDLSFTLAAFEIHGWTTFIGN
jgi:hypothetical protein